MPQMGYDMQAGTLVRWLKSEGDEVSMGDPIAEIETDKAVVEFESTESGVLHRLIAGEGDTVPVGQAIAIIGSAHEEIPDKKATPGAALPDEPTSEEARQPATAPTPPGETKASPVARRLAGERGINLKEVSGTGPGGRITKDDILKFEPLVALEAPLAPKPTITPPPTASPVPVAPTPSPAPAMDGEKIPLTKMRSQIARVTSASKRTIPHFYVSADIDMTSAMSLRRQINTDLDGDGVRVSLNDLVIKACVNAINKHPKLNAYFTNDGIQMNQSINIGVAIAEENGLTMPAILDCGHKSLPEIAIASKDLIQRSQSGTLHPSEYTGGTFSISNMGMFGVTSFVAIIQPPQSAVLAVGTVKQAPVIRDGEVVIADIMPTTVSVDHRVSDGAEGAQFIVEVKDQLEHPTKLLLQPPNKPNRKLV